MKPTKQIQSQEKNTYSSNLFYTYIWLPRLPHRQPKPPYKQNLMPTRASTEKSSKKRRVFTAHGMTIAYHSNNKRELNTYTVRTLLEAILPSREICSVFAVGQAGRRPLQWGPRGGKMTGYPPNTWHGQLITYTGCGHIEN